MGKYKIGFARRIITPQKPMQMGGYHGERISEGIHDDLFVKTVVLEEQTTKKLIIFAVYDLIGIDYSIKNKILETYSPDTQLIIFASHTHSGPSGTVMIDNKDSVSLGKLDDEYLEFIISKTIQAIDESIYSLENFKYTLTNGKIRGAYSNRQNPEGYMNDQISVLNINTFHSNAVIYHFSCHPTILKSNNRLFSKDLVWGVNSQLKLDFLCFVNGTAGDVSTRFTRASDDYEEVLKTGKIIVDKIKELSKDKDEVRVLEKCEIYSFEVNLKTKSPHSQKDLLSEINKLKLQLKNDQGNSCRGNIRILETKIQGYERELIQSDYLKTHSEIILNCNLIIWDDYLIVTVPGELFSSLAKPMLEKYPNLTFVTYAEGSIGYITDTSGYNLNYYESMSSLLEKGQGEIFMKEIEKNIKDNYYAT